MKEVETKRSSLGMIMAIYLFGIFMGAIDTGIVTPARTIIQNNLSADEKTGIWMITIYTLAYAASIPVMGKLADKFGRKYIYLTSIFLFGLGSLFCGLSQDFGSFGLLLAARVVQAIGGGGIMPVATAEFGTTFPVEKRGMALGLVGGVYGIANIFGSSAGSAILDIFGKNNWQFIFYINIPITLFVLIAGFMILPNSKAPDVKKIDKLGILLVVAMVLSLLYGLRNIDFFDFTATITSIGVYPFLMAFVILLPLFILVEKRAEDPVMNLSFFTNARILITLIVGFIVGIVMMGMIFVPQFAENTLHIASGSGGYFVIVLGVFTGVSAPLSGKLIDKIGVKIVLGSGFVITIIGSLFLVFVTTVYLGIVNVGICLLLIGLGLGFVMGAPLNYMMLENTRKEESNSALAALSLVRSIGTTIAPAIMIGFLAHAGGTVQANIMSLLPKEIAPPALPYARELTGTIGKMKDDPNMKDKLASVEIPDLSAPIKIEFSENSEYKMPADLLELMKTADVTNITERVKTLSSRMFDEMTPEVVRKIQEGVQQGIDGMQSGIPAMDQNSLELQKGVTGLTEAIKGMQDGAAGLNQGIGQMTEAIRRQKVGLVQMTKLYKQMSSITTGIIGNPKEMARAGMGQDAPGPVQGNTAETAISPSAGMPQKATEATQGTAPGMPQAMAAEGGLPDITDIIPAKVRSSIPKDVLTQLKGVKTPAQLKVKIGGLEQAIQTLEGNLTTLKQQREELLAGISKSESNIQQMKDAIAAIKKAKLDLQDTIRKMTELKNAVPAAFETAKNSYITEIGNLSPRIEAVFQHTLNAGFKQIYLTAAIAAAAALLILLFYGGKKEDAPVAVAKQESE